MKRDKILLVDACIRKKSRTRELAEFVISGMEGDVFRVDCTQYGPITAEDFLSERQLAARAEDRQAACLQAACLFAQADVIVIAAPYWDLSFPAVLKSYLEQINVAGITFQYTAEGRPQGLCRCRKLIYVTTAGGEFVSEDYGYGYVRALAKTFYGIPETVYVKAGGLDIEGADADMILKLAKAHYLAKEQFRGRTDKAGTDYYSGHLCAVADLVKTDEEKTAALLHDILEDTDYPESQLRAVFGDQITDAVCMVTHKEHLDDEGYLSYIRNLKASGNRLAVAVKIADLTNNSDITRLGAKSVSDLSEKDRKRWEKYQKSLELLKQT